MTIDAMIRAVQGHVGATIDGRTGPETWSKIYLAIVGRAPLDVDPVDERSERNIATLHPEVKPFARSLVHAAKTHGITIKIISGTRTYAEQNALYNQGRTTPGPRVTNARGGYSNHNFGIAFDVGVFDGSSYVPESPRYKAVGAIGQSLGLEWGGNWRTIVDEPHFQLRPSWADGLTERDMLAELRRRKASGKDAFA